MGTFPLTAKLTRAELEIRQAELVVEAVEAQDEPLPRRHELTKPGDPATLRGFPILIEGGYSSAITSSEPLPNCIKCGRSTERRARNPCRCRR